MAKIEITPKFYGFDRSVRTQYSFYNLLRKLGIVDLHIGGNTHAYEVIFKSGRKGIR